MFKKSGLVRRWFFFILFVVGMFLLVLLIKYSWDFNQVVESVVNLIGKKEP